MFNVYYLKTTNRPDFIADMLLAGHDLSAWIEGDKFETDGLSVDWIGQIPYPLTEEQEAANDAAILGGQELPYPVTFRPLLHVNVLTAEEVELDTEAFQSTSTKNPTTPFRTFAT